MFSFPSFFFFVNFILKLSQISLTKGLNQLSPFLPHRPMSKLAFIKCLLSATSLDTSWERKEALGAKKEYSIKLTRKL